MNKMEAIKKTCFVCKTEFQKDTLELNVEVNLLVCKKCRGSEQEKEEVKILLDSLADGFVCGCI
jgi:hypothetical protein